MISPYSIWPWFNTLFSNGIPYWIIIIFNFQRAKTKFTCVNCINRIFAIALSTLQGFYVRQSQVSFDFFPLSLMLQEINVYRRWKNISNPTFCMSRKHFLCLQWLQTRQDVHFFIMRSCYYQIKFFSFEVFGSTLPYLLYIYPSHFIFKSIVGI